MANRIHADRHERDEEREPRRRPRTASGRDPRRRRAPPRREGRAAGFPVYEYVMSPTSTRRRPLRGRRTARAANDPLEPEQQQDDEHRLRRRLDRHPPELEEPRRESGEDDDDRRDEPAPRQPPRENAEEEHRGEHEQRGETTRDLLVGSGDLEDPSQQIRVHRALVVVERAQESGRPAPSSSRRSIDSVYAFSDSAASSRWYPDGSTA